MAQEKYQYQKYQTCQHEPNKNCENFHYWLHEVLYPGWPNQDIIMEILVFFANCFILSEHLQSQIKKYVSGSKSLS